MGRSSKLFKTIVAGVKTFQSPSSSNTKQDNSDHHQRKGHKQRCLWNLGKSRKRDIVVSAPFSNVAIAKAVLQRETTEAHLHHPPSPLFTGDLPAKASPAPKGAATEHHGHGKSSEEEEEEGRVVIYDPPEEQAAVKIQAAIRCYLARRAYHDALKALVRLQALFRRRRTRRQAATTLRCIRALVRVQAHARGRRIRESELGELVRRHLQQAKQQRRKLGEGGTAAAKSQNRQDAAMKRALLHDLCEQLHRSTTFKRTSSSDFPPDEGHWAWVWLELWTAAHFNGTMRVTTGTNGLLDLMAIQNKAAMDRVESSTHGHATTVNNELHHAQNTASSELEEEVFTSHDIDASSNGRGDVQGDVLLRPELKSGQDETPLMINSKNKDSMKTLIELEVSKGNGILGFNPTDSEMYSLEKKGKDSREAQAVREEKAASPPVRADLMISPGVEDPGHGSTREPLPDFSTDILSGVNLKPLVTSSDAVCMDDGSEVRGISVCSKARPTVLDLMNSSSDALTAASQQAQFESPARQSPSPSSAFSLVGCYSPSQPVSPASLTHGSPPYGTASPSVAGGAYEIFTNGMDVTREIGPSTCMNGGGAGRSEAGDKDEATLCVTVPANGTHELIIQDDADDAAAVEEEEPATDQESDLRAKLECQSQSSIQEHNSTPVSKQQQSQGSKQQAEQISPSVPNYMATTKSSMAKARSVVVVVSSSKQKQDLRTDSPKQKKRSPKLRGEQKTAESSPHTVLLKKTESPNLKTDSPKPDAAAVVRRRFLLSALEGNTTTATSTTMTTTTTTISPTTTAHSRPVIRAANNKGDSPGLKNRLQAAAHHK